jgi:hypothetical protein
MQFDAAAGCLAAAHLGATAVRRLESVNLLRAASLVVISVFLGRLYE